MVDDIFKKANSALKVVTDVGTGAIIGNVASMFLGNTILPVKVCAYVGSYILSMMLSEKTDEYIDRKTDEYKADFDEMRNTIKEEEG